MIRDGGTGSTNVRQADAHLMTCELLFVAGRIYAGTLAHRLLQPGAEAAEPDSQATAHRPHLELP